MYDLEVVIIEPHVQSSDICSYICSARLIDQKFCIECEVSLSDVMCR